MIKVTKYEIQTQTHTRNPFINDWSIFSQSIEFLFITAKLDDCFCFVFDFDFRIKNKNEKICFDLIIITVLFFFFSFTNYAIEIENKLTATAVELLLLLRPVTFIRKLDEQENKTKQKNKPIIYSWWYSIDGEKITVMKYIVSLWFNVY